MKVREIRSVDELSDFQEDSDIGEMGAIAGSAVPKIACGLFAHEHPEISAKLNGLDGEKIIRELLYVIPEVLF